MSASRLRRRAARSSPRAATDTSIGGAAGTGGWYDRHPAARQSPPPHPLVLGPALPAGGGRAGPRTERGAVRSRAVVGVVMGATAEGVRLGALYGAAGL